MVGVTSLPNTTCMLTPTGLGERRPINLARRQVLAAQLKVKSKDAVVIMTLGLFEFILLIRPYEGLTSVRLEPVERLVCFEAQHERFKH
jgi:hypothetical protein